VSLYKNKKILAIIPARGGSKGIKLKNLCKINKKTLIEITAETVKDTKYIDEAVISSDHDGIIEEAKKFGLSCYFKRPFNLSRDRIADLPVLQHALKTTETATGQKYDIILMLQPTSPMRNSKDIENVICKVINNDFDTVWTIFKVDHKFHPDKQLIIKQNQKLDYYSENGHKIIARQQLKDSYNRDGLVYGYTRKALLENNLILGKNPGFVITKRYTVNIDSIEDLKEAELLLGSN
jgi:CMP-N,N'-diacetyllegionaminic acid synthase